jgi:hypothetical protein
LSGHPTARHDRGDPQPNQVLGQRRELIEFSSREPRFERDVLPLDITQLANLLLECRPPLQALAGVEQPDDGRPGGGRSA